MKYIAQSDIDYFNNTKIRGLTIHKVKQLFDEQNFHCNYIVILGRQSFLY